MKLNVLLVAAAALHVAYAGKLPLGLKACSRNEPDESACSLKNGQAAIPHLVKGNPSYGLMPMDPLHFSEIVVDDKTSTRQVAISLTMQDVDFIGLAGTQLTKFKMGHKNEDVVWEGKIPLLEILGKYNVSGRVLILPISGAGAMNFTLENVEFKYKFHLEHEFRNGVEYIKPTDTKLDFVTSRCHINLENLFNGDKRLSEQMNVFLNENWKEMVQDMGPPIADALNSAFRQILEAISKQVPYEDFHPDTPV